MDSGPLSKKIIHFIGRFPKPKKGMREIVKDLGGKNWRRGCEQLPTDLILAPATTAQQKEKIKNEVGEFEEISAEFETDTLNWLFELWDRENGEKHTESLSTTPTDRTTEIAREGHENLFSIRNGSAISTIVPDTPPSNIQDKVTTAIVEPVCTRQCAPVGAHNRVVERPRVLCIDKASPSPLKRAGEVYVKFIPVMSYVDEYGNYIVVPNAKLTEMFEVVESIGEGAYGRVVKARIVVEGDDTCIQAQMCFEYRGHICMVMDLLGQSTYEFLKKNKCAPYPDSQIQSFARQLFGSVAFHGDIKPQNIVLCKASSRILPYNRLRPSSSRVIFGEGRYAAERRVLVNTEVRLIDFGLATFLDESPSYFHSTPAYSAPETRLYHQASFSHHIWSIGCTLVEFFTGDHLFKTPDMLEYLAMIEAIAGLKIEEEIAWITDAKFRGILSAMQEPRKKVQWMKMKHLDQIIPGNNAFLKNFADLLKRIFVLNPNQRITAKQALQHPFLVEEAQPDDGLVAAKVH
ncbi:kinase-like domain-containing protein [Fusarium oxysporum f. sp. albedinis]|nr:kinase-like domain-containing protein [Fusarium oxysporum f. sp. albedinis]